MTRSVRFKITALAVIVFAALSTIGGVVLVVLERQTLTESVDDAVEQRAADLVGVLRSGSVPELGGGDDFVAQVVSVDGEVLASSRVLPATEPVLPPPGARAVRGTTELPEVDRSRYLSTTVEVPGRGATVLHVAGSLDDVEEATTALAAFLAIGIPLVVVALGGTVWWLVGRTLSPVERIRAEVATFGPEGWRRRVPEPGTGDEVDRLAQTMNEMLARLEESVERQRRFVDDASHELRTPLTRLRTRIEVDRDDPDVDATTTMAATAEDLLELTTLVEDLLVLARIDAGRARPSIEVDLDDVAADAARRHRDGGARIDTTGIGAGRVVGDERLLHRAVDNLVRNAVRHARSRVWVGVTTSGDRAVVEVADDGPGVPTSERDRIFERFTRLDGSRSRDDGGTGLGLAIVREAAEVHGGTITVDDRPGGGARFRLALPAHDQT